MIPITRKELYLNKIVGNNDYETPEKPITIEEFFFAEILGEAVQAPEPLTRYQIYLAKIAGRNIETPYPETRLEYFLARAAGMDISTPVPITKEEIYWSNYTAIVEFEFEGVPPLTYKAIEGTLKNYRIYGNTVNGENVGDLITEGEHAGEYCIPVMVVNGTDTKTTNIYLPEQIRKVEDEFEYIDYKKQKLYRVRKNLFDKNSYKVSGYVSDNGTIIISGSVEISTFDYIKVTAQKLYSFKAFSSTTPSEYQRTVRVAYYDKNKNYLSRIVKSGAGLEGFSFETPVNCQYIRLSIDENLFDNMLVKGNLIPIEYEPFIEDTEVDVTLPSISTLAGTNVLTVGTKVQPSKVYIKGEKGRD